MLSGSVQLNLTADGTSGGVVTVSSNGAFYVNALVYLVSTTQSRLDLMVTDLIGSTQFRVRNVYSTTFLDYRDISAYLVADGARVVRPIAETADIGSGGGGGSTPTGPAGGDLGGTYPSPTVLKTNGVSFAASATVDTTDASNISSGTLSNSRLSAVPDSALATMGAHTYKGNNTGSTAIPADITSTQLTADLNQFTSSLQGLVPASAGGTVNFLRADGSWSAPAGTAGITALTGDVTASGPGSAGAAVVKINGVTLGTTTATAGNLLIGQGSSWVTEALSGDGVLTSAGVLTVTKTNGVAFAASATTDTTNASNISSGTLANARTTGVSTNTVSTLVLRDGSGNFSAATITAALTGTASGNTMYTANNHGVVLSGSANVLTVLAPDASTAKVLTSGGASADPTWSNSPALSGANFASATIPNSALVNAAVANLSGTNTGDQTITLTGGVTGSGTGSFAATVVTNANLTGPVTSTGNATTIANGAISNAMLANGAVANLSGTNTGDVTLAAVGASPSANAASLSGQALTLQPFDGTHPGVVTASGGGTSNFLRADGTWVAPPGTGITALTGDVTASGSGSVAATVAKINGAVLGTTTASAANVLVGDGSAWQSVALSGDATVSSAGVLHIQFIDAQLFGDGSDGDVSISGGTTTITRDMYYHNLTMSGTGVLVTNGYIVFVANILDITAGAANAIRFLVTAAAPQGGTGVAAGTGGSAAGGISSGTVGGNSSSSGQGGAGAVTNGGAGTTTAGSAISCAGANGATSAAKGGAGGSGTGGTGGAGGTITNNATGRLIFRRPGNYVYMRTGTVATAQTVLPSGGGAGGGTGSVAGAGGGGNGGMNGCVVVAARTINRGGSTATGCISSVGGQGGTGGTTTTTGCGGGGGGGGGSGGWVQVLYRFLTGSTATNCLDVSGGIGGTGGNGVGSGNGGTGGQGGAAGSITVYNAATNTWADTTTVGAGGAGTANTGVTGGPGGTKITSQVSL